jgi:hypothetical protein
MIIAPDELVQLQILQRQYLQLVEPSQLKWPVAEVLKRPEVQAWTFLHMFDENSIKSPPPERYQLRVLKLLIAKLERAIVDPEEDVWFPISSSCLFHILADRRRPEYLYCQNTIYHFLSKALLPLPSVADSMPFQRAGDLR